MASIADVFSVIGAVAALIVIPAAYQPIISSIKSKAYKELVDVEWGNEGDISIHYPYHLLLRLQKAQGDWSLSGELTCSINLDETFYVRGKLKHLGTVEAEIFRTIGWRTYQIGVAKIKLNRRTNRCQFIPRKLKKIELITPCEQSLFSRNLPLWQHHKVSS